MAYFPFMIQLDDKQCLIVGGGVVAARKAAQMCEFGARVTVVAPEICMELLVMESKDLTEKPVDTLTENPEENAENTEADANDTVANAEESAFEESGTIEENE